MPLSNNTLHKPVRARVARAALCAAVATATACGAGAATADPRTDPTATDCPRWTALLVPGTFETTPTTDPGEPVGVLAAVAESLTSRYGNDIDVRTLTRTTDTTPADPSEATAEHALTAALSALCSRTQVVLAGYAEGAATAGDLAASIGNNEGPISASRVVAVGLISDPHRDPTTTQLGTPVSGHGVAGPRTQGFGDLGERVRTVCPADDLYCSTTSEVSNALAAVGRALIPTPTPTRTTAPSRPSTVTSTPPSPATSTPTPTTTSPRITTSTGELTLSQVLAQVVTVVNGLALVTANVPAIVADLAELPGLVAAGDVRGLHRVAGDLNNQFAPLVAMAAEIDLRLVSRLLAVAAPLDTTGIAAIASEIVGVLAGLDIARIATNVGRAQEIAWTAAEILAAGDPVAAALALTGLAPIAADLLAATASAFTGGTSLPSLAPTYTATTTDMGDPTRTDNDTAVFGGHDIATATTLLAEWIVEAIDGKK
ncbi:cutinase family protein [Nocardia sp. NPDC058176]|uniref:cutinase family protein n=1 Tax=Nocardia sp. NPDC058176 TaxID=3346368 RepID=UPI0036DDDF01